MKSQKTSPLVLLLRITIIALAGFQFTFAQKPPKDSLAFYRSAILNPDKETDITAAFTYFRTKVNEDLEKGDTLSAVSKLRTMIIGQLDMGIIYESEETAIEARRLLDNLPKSPEKTHSKKGLYNDLGRIYRMLESPSHALRFYNKALELSINAMDSLMIINNIGNVYSDSDNYIKAKEYFDKANEISLRLSDRPNEARALDNLGYNQSKLNDPDALENMQKALRIRLEQNDQIGTYSSYKHLAEYYQQRQNNTKALENAEKAYALAQTINSPSFVIDALTNLLNIEGDSKTKDYIRLTDSLDRAKLNAQNKYAALQYNISKAREQAETDKFLREKAIRKSEAFQFLGFILIVAMGAIYLIIRIQHKRKTLQEVYNTETRISKRVHDEVANDVYRLMSKVQYNKTDDDDLLDDLEIIYNRTRDISRENAQLIIDENYGNQIKELIQSYQDGRVVITTQNISSINWKAFPDIKKRTTYRVIQELMTNMRKYSQAKLVLLSFEQNGKKIQIKYSDNGVGSDVKAKNGLRNVENRIKAIKGSFTFDSIPNKGFRATIKV